MNKFLNTMIAGGFLAVAAIVAPAVITGCSTTQQRASYNTLYSVGQSVNTAYKNYIDLVIQGAVKTNNVPAISKAYNAFQAEFLVAVEIMALTTNAPPPAKLVGEAEALTVTITEASKEAK